LSQRFALPDTSRGAVALEVLGSSSGVSTLRARSVAGALTRSSHAEFRASGAGSPAATRSVAALSLVGSALCARVPRISVLRNVMKTLADEPRPDVSFDKGALITNGRPFSPVLVRMALCTFDSALFGL
jgi:hypothetical protein